MDIRIKGDQRFACIEYICNSIELNQYLNIILKEKLIDLTLAHLCLDYIHSP